MSTFKKATATVFMTLALAGVGAGTASAAGPDKCANNPENFQMVGGVCVSDGKAEKLNDRK
ncbi:MAG TPA: hypothetical protein VHF92_08240 [Geodermatophilus sp.]|nr:hypothetical protein [Geodermatophilus sp.]